MVDFTFTDSQYLFRWLNVSANKLQWFDYAFIPKQLEWIDLHQVIIIIVIIVIVVVVVVVVIIVVLHV